MYSLSCYSLYLFVLCQIHGHAIRDLLRVDEENLKERQCDFEAEQSLGHKSISQQLHMCFIFG